MNPNKRTDILFDEEAREKVLKGVETLYQAVSSTLGPNSRAVGVDYGYMRKINKDGVSVAKAIELPDNFENFGVSIVREAAQKTVDEVGDGTTVTIVLAHAIIQECLKYIRNGRNPMSLRKGLEEGVELIIEDIKGRSTPITTLEEKIRVATISASGDEFLGKLIATTLDEIGENGLLAVDVNKEYETKVVKQEGMQIDQGYADPWFITDPNKMVAALDDVPVLITDKDIDDPGDFGAFMQKTAQHTTKLVIIAPRMNAEIMAVLVNLKLQGKFLPLFIKAPSVGQNQKEMLKDLCALTGATYVTSEAGHTLATTPYESLGKIKKITSTNKTTLISGGEGKKEDIEERCARILAQLETDTELSEFDEYKLRERWGKLNNGVAVLRVGGATEIEASEREERAKDAIGATKAAIKSGIVPGGETIFINSLVTLHGDEGHILREAITKPIEKLMENAGYSYVEHRSKLRLAKTEGFDVTDGTIKDMIETGIIDPTLVPITALRNALSVAVQIITLGCVIVPIKEDK